VEIFDNKALLLRLRNPQRITTVIPKSKELPDNKVAVHWGIEEARVLRNLNIKAPSPIMGKYKWTGQYAPFEHQKHTADFLTMNRKSFCFSEMGTGKTASAIWAADFLMNHNHVRRALVICPLSIMDSAWRADLFKFAMHRRVDIAYGPASKRKKIINNGAEFIITNYAGVEILYDEIENGEFDLIIVDEATHYKNPQTNRWKVLNKLVKPETWLWMLTGTPAAQSPLDAYGLAKLVNPANVPRYAGTFKEMVMYKISQFKWIPRETATETVFNALQPAIRYTKEQCLDLPEMVYTKRKVEMTRQQTKYYNLLKNQMSIAAAGESVTAHNAAISLNKLLQISSGAVYTDDAETLEFDIKHRYAVLKEVIEESTQKVLVFVPFRSTIDVLTEKLQKDGVSTGIIRGDVSAGKRTELFRAFQDTPDPQVLIIQPQAAAHGVTLTAANTVVWWGPVSSLETYSQANARVHRSGQEHKCTVVQLFGSYAEQHVYKLLDNRIDVHTKIIDLYQEILD
jgi:SNF2 family DNA or RNA helicase